MATAQAPDFVVLDKTLANYLQEQCESAEEHFAIVGVYPVGLCSSTERCVFHDANYGTIKNNGQVDHTADLVQARIDRSLGVMKFSMCAGKIKFIAFNVEKCGSFAQQIQDNQNILDTSQRAQMVLLKNAGKLKSLLKTPEYRSAIIANRLPIDELRGLPVVLDCDILYTLLTKRGLAMAPFATPKFQLVDLGADEEVTAIQKSKSHQPPKHVISRYKEEATNAVARRELPFVVKLQQTVSGNGTWILKTAEARSTMLSQLPYLLDENIKRTVKDNCNLRPATLIISDFVKTDPKNTTSYAVTFFIKRHGFVEDEITPGFEIVGCCSQDLGEDAHWEGASINFLAQGALHQRFEAITMEVAQYLHTEGYYGMVGIDILEDLDGKQWVVDMNVRPPGSLILCLLRNHLSVARGFHHASLISQMKMIVNRDSFVLEFERDIGEGRIIVNAWFKDESTREDYASFVVAGETKENVLEVVGRIKKLEA